MNRLLRPTEPQGICRVPVIVCALMKAQAWRALTAFKPTVITGASYGLAEATVVGVSKDQLTERQLQVFSKLVDDTTALCGPVIETTTHHYLLAVPRACVESADLVVYGWYFTDLVGVIT